jgi:hypothetical protein
MLRAPEALRYRKDDRPASFEGHDILPVVFSAIEEVAKKLLRNYT